MKILITNDDGIRAPGIQALAHVAKDFGDVLIVAPDHERSACGHGMTMRDPLRIRPVAWDGAEAYEANGLPTDCINLGREIGGPIDLVLSGINQGPNLGFDITYSGTAAGAMEGCINGIRSISLSMACIVEGAPAHWVSGETWLRKHLTWLIGLDLPERTFLNVNIPAIAYDEIQGYRFCEMGQRVYEDRVERRDDPWGRTYFWQGGVAVLRGDQPGTDVNAVSEGYVSITPVSLNWTHQDALRQLQAASHPALA